MRSLDDSFAEDPYYAVKTCWAISRHDALWNVTVRRESPYICILWSIYVAPATEQDSLRYTRFRFLSTWLNLPSWRLGASPEMKQGTVFRNIHIQLLRKVTVKPPDDRHGDSMWRRSLLGGADRWSTFRSKHEGRVNLVVQATTANLLVSLHDRHLAGGEVETEEKDSVVL